MIHGLEQRMRPPRLGTIRLGVVIGSGHSQHPQEVPHFVVPPEIAAVYGKDPTSLPIRFPWSDPERVLHTMSYELRRGRSVVRRCDGTTYAELAAAGRDTIGVCARDRENVYAACPEKCRARAKLSVIVQKTKPLGIWEIPLGGIQRIADLLAELRLYRAAVGPLTHLPFDLVRMPTQEQYYKLGGEVAWRTGYPVRLRCPYTVEEVVAFQEARGLPVALPPAPHEEDIVDTDEDPGNGETPRVTPPIMSEETKPVEKEEEWDHSMIAASAAKIGVKLDLLDRYLLACYGHPLADLGNDALHKEAQLFRKIKSEAEGQVKKAEMIRVINDALKRARHR